MHPLGRNMDRPDARPPYARQLFWRGSVAHFCEGGVASVGRMRSILSSGSGVITRPSRFSTLMSSLPINARRGSSLEVMSQHHSPPPECGGRAPSFSTISSGLPLTVEPLSLM